MSMPPLMFAQMNANYFIVLIVINDTLKQLNIKPNSLKVLEI